MDGSGSLEWWVFAVIIGSFFLTLIVGVKAPKKGWGLAVIWVGYPMLVMGLFTLIFTYKIFGAEGNYLPPLFGWVFLGAFAYFVAEAYDEN